MSNPVNNDETAPTTIEKINTTISPRIKQAVKSVGAAVGFIALGFLIARVTQPAPAIHADEVDFFVIEEAAPIVTPDESAE